MIAVTPSAMYDALGAVFSALIVVACLVGLTLHRDVYDNLPRRDFFCYYTNLSNLLVLIYFMFAAPLLFRYPAMHKIIPLIEYSVVMSIMLTNIVFHGMILPAVRPLMPDIVPDRCARLLAANNLFVHYIVPWLTFSYWLFCSPEKSRLTLAGSLLWMAFPLLYIGCMFLRAKRHPCIAGTRSRYPYPFLNVDALGVRHVTSTCLKISAACAAVSILVFAMIHMLYALLGGGWPIVLI